MKLFEKLNETFNALTQNDLSWKNREYDFYLLFGETDENKSPWLKTNWKTDFEPFFDTIISQAETAKETGIRVHKFKREKRTTNKNEEFIYHNKIKLGRLKWDAKSHDKWTVGDTNEEYFQSFELWTPIWTVCEKRNSPPEIFISISNEESFDNSRNIQLGYFIVVAIAQNLKIDSKSILAELSKKVNTKATVVKKRKWGTPEKNKNWIFNNGIQDTFSTGIYKNEDLNTLNFNDMEFEPVWEVIYKQE